jgi:hypothetical protein
MEKGAVLILGYLCKAGHRRHYPTSARQLVSILLVDRISCISVSNLQIGLVFDVVLTTAHFYGARL